ncbi:uncharacterized protein LOC125647227 isoform X2 [Ostrea edulis]|uniref:uncharacterized protein LOC125647227 isoform X2 n=1 Tax=Ostrea edulis TaxID=37623 RepID=UPI0024AF962B|nr:uncharacterized protein LOC125647227 isoform X2 [Ostrea edulis]
MTCRGLLSVIYFTTFVPFSSLGSIAICVHNITRQSECCQDYRNVSGTCEACIGSWGKDCQYSCEFGFYGHGCREKCNCSQDQRCDPRSGCVEISHNVTDTKQSESGEALSPVVLAVGGVLVLSLVGTVWIVLLKLAQNKKEGEIRETVAPGNGCTFQNGEQECIYNDVRESQMMENSAISLSGKCTSLKHDPNRNIPKNHCRSLPRRQYAQWRNQLTRSKTLAPGHYGGYNRYSDDYNHLHFDKMPALPDNTTASISMDDYGIMKPKYEKTSSQNTNAEVRMSADKKKHPTMSRSETKCRPYSSVKYNRKVEME